MNLCLLGTTCLKFLDILPFGVVDRYFNYLGLNLTKDATNLFKANFTEIINKPKVNIEAWRILPLTIFGQVNAINAT